MSARVPANSDARRFARAVRLRLAVASAIEGAGVGMAFGAGFALPVIGLLAWAGKTAAPVATATLGVGAAAGLANAFRRRPTVPAAAREADRQLGWDDLLATALACDAATGPWAASVRAAAAAACARTSPSAVVTRRLTGRAWGGIAVAACVVLTLSLLAAPPGASDNPAIAAPRPAFAGLANIRPPDSRPQPTAAATPSVAAASSSSAPRRPNDDTPETPAAPGASAPLKAAASGPPAPRPGTGGTSGTGGGTSMARTGTANVPRAPANPPSPPSPAKTTGTTVAGGGPGTPGTPPDISPLDPLQGPAGATAAPVATPWAAAGPAVPSDDTRGAPATPEVPAAYRDVTRAYFDRDADVDADADADVIKP